MFPKHSIPETPGSEKVRLPYFDDLLTGLKTGNAPLAESFGRHVHWGYWESPQAAKLTAEDFANAAEELSKQVCLAGHVRDNISVADIGCGFGGTIAHINDHFAGMNLIGVNIDERQLARARELVVPADSNRIEFKQGNACALALPDASFDVVLAVECIFHFPKREQFFREAWRILKPGGYLALSDFLPKKPLKPFLKVKATEKFNIGFYGKCNLEFGVADYRELAQKTQFAITTERDITVNTLPTYRYLRRLSQHYRIRNPFAVIETAAAELFSRLSLLDYYIFGFQKPK